MTPLSEAVAQQQYLARAPIEMTSRFDVDDPHELPATRTLISMPCFTRTV